VSAAQRRLEALAAEPLAAVGRTQGGRLGNLRDVWAFRELLALLVRRELKVRYKDSTLGFLWSLLRPLALLVVYYVALGKFLGAERAIPDFAIYIFTGLTVWQLFAEIVSGGTGSILGNAGLVKKVYLPREVFPLSVVGSALVNLAVQLGILVVATAALGVFPTGSRWVFLPLSLLVVLVWGTALGLLFSALNVFLRDVQYLVEIGLMVMFWTTPVVYSWAQVLQATGGSTLLQQLYLANPAAVAVMGLQQTFWVSGTGSPVPDDLATRMGVMVLVGLVLVWVAHRVFVRLAGNFAQEL
jgi:ABC-2 type transport system permease protein